MPNCPCRSCRDRSANGGDRSGSSKRTRFHSCGCIYVLIFGETEHDSSQQLTSVPIEEQLDAFGRVLGAGKVVSTYKKFKDSK